MTPARPEWQRDARHVPDAPWDVVVVGGGPAGSTAALHLGGRGLRVLLLERHPYPRDKACGDLLIADAIAALDRAGVLAAVRARAHRLEDAVISSPSRIRWSIPGEYLMLPRRDLDALLAQEAASRGVVVAEGRAERIVPLDGGEVEVRVAGREDPLRTSVLVLATGADVSLATELGMVRRSAPDAVAVRSYVGSAARLEPLFLSFDREILPGYAWIFPAGGDEYNVGVGVLHDPARPARHDLHALFHRFCAEVPEARAVVDNARERSRLRGARLRCGLSGSLARGPGNVLAVGEQIGTTYPFTGEGIGKAMESGEMAAAHVRDYLARGDFGALDAYAERLERELRPRYRGYELAQRWLSRPWLNDLVARRIRRGGRLAEAVRGVVAETVDPATVFSWRGVLRSLAG